MLRKKRYKKRYQKKNRECAAAAAGELREIRVRDCKRQCVILGAMAILLAGGLVIKIRNRNYEVPDESGHQIQVVEGMTEYWGGQGKSGGETTDPLILVNKDHELSEDYRVKLHWLENRSCAVADLMYDALREMLTDGSTEGRAFVVASGYRSREFQQALLTEDIDRTMQQEGVSWEEAYEKETKETMPPGYSEHETGLAVDIVSVENQVLDEGQEMTSENQWLREHCSEYGFILRYPRGSGAVTGINYEPWHFRYVGVDAAREITARGITLEEYLNS